MQHARSDYGHIQDTSAARELAELILSMQMGTPQGLRARQLARQVLGVPDHGEFAGRVPIHTNGTLRVIPKDEPVFLIRGQDVAGGDAVRAWADLAEKVGGAPDILAVARDHAAKMDAWPKKKVPDFAPTYNAGSRP
ncbi:hypothetical protein HNR00_003529 [Methylorubrum rhodinum]|uniref:Uncharacterized protein n=1 Tax=Methylorubrum rhodinum TaxID=29428 RepID=A0A840ZL18_9HYPH|nr:hypothetical protein [Methylorubrum rhodinum]MBB5758802.1 hypothetical protein [Methylorubrum rhodinum]